MFDYSTWNSEIASTSGGSGSAPGSSASAYTPPPALEKAPPAGQAGFMALNKINPHSQEAIMAHNDFGVPMSDFGKGGFSGGMLQYEQQNPNGGNNFALSGSGGGAAPSSTFKKGGKVQRFEGGDSVSAIPDGDSESAGDQDGQQSTPPVTQATTTDGDGGSETTPTASKSSYDLNLDSTMKNVLQFSRQSAGIDTGQQTAANDRPPLSPSSTSPIAGGGGSWSGPVSRPSQGAPATRSLPLQISPAGGATTNGQFGQKQAANPPRIPGSQSNTPGPYIPGGAPPINVPIAQNAARGGAVKSYGPGGSVDGAIPDDTNLQPSTNQQQDTSSPMPQSPVGQSQNPAQLASYVMGTNRMPPDQFMALRQQIDPTGQMDGTERTARVIASGQTPTDQMQRMNSARTMFNTLRSMSGAAAQGTGQNGPNTKLAAALATRAFEMVPDGNSVQFSPTNGGVVAHVKSLIKNAKGPAASGSKSYKDGGSVQRFEDGNPVQAIPDSGDNSGDDMQLPSIQTDDGGSDQTSIPMSNQQFASFIKSPGAGFDITMQNDIGSTLQQGVKNNPDQAPANPKAVAAGDNPAVPQDIGLNQPAAPKNTQEARNGTRSASDANSMNYVDEQNRGAAERENMREQFERNKAVYEHENHQQEHREDESNKRMEDWQKNGETTQDRERAQSQDQTKAARSLVEKMIAQGAQLNQIQAQYPDLYKQAGYAQAAAPEQFSAPPQNFEARQIGHPYMTAKGPAVWAGPGKDGKGYWAPYQGK